MITSCNIGNNERVARVLIAVILLLAAVFEMGRGFLFLFGILLAAEGFLGWCVTPLLVEKFKLHNIFKDKQL